MEKLKEKLISRLEDRVYNHNELIDNIITDFKESEEFKQLILHSVSERFQGLQYANKIQEFHKDLNNKIGANIKPFMPQTIKIIRLFRRTFL